MISGRSLETNFYATDTQTNKHTESHMEVAPPPKKWLIYTWLKTNQLTQTLTFNCQLWIYIHILQEFSILSF